MSRTPHGFFSWTRRRGVSLAVAALAGAAVVGCASESGKSPLTPSAVAEPAATAPHDSPAPAGDPAADATPTPATLAITMAIRSSERDAPGPHGEDDGYLSRPGEDSTAHAEEPPPPFHVTATCGAQRFSAVTDSQGQALIPGVPVGRCVVTAHRPGWVVTVQRDFVEKLYTITLSAEREAVVVVDIEDDAKHPVGGPLYVRSQNEVVEAFDEEMSGFPPDEYEDAEGSRPAGRGQHLYQVPPSGHLELRGLRGGTYALWFSVDGYTERQTELRVASGERHAERIDVGKFDTFLALSGQPTEDIALRVSRAGGPSGKGGDRGSQEYGRGEVRLGDLEPGRYHVSGWSGPNAVSMDVEVPPGSVQRLALATTPPVCPRVRVVDDEGDPVTAAELLGFERAAHGWRPLEPPPRTPFMKDGSLCNCFAPSVGRIAIVRPPFAVAVLDMGRAGVPVVHLHVRQQPPQVLSRFVTQEGDGAFVYPEEYEFLPGLKAGDRVLAVEGVPLESLVPPEVEQRLDGAPGTPVHLALLRGGAVKQVTVRRP